MAAWIGGLGLVAGAAAGAAGAPSGTPGVFVDSGQRLGDGFTRSVALGDLDGDEDVHCLEDDPRTDIAVEEMDFRPNDYLIRKRRYSAFFGTDFEILLRGLRVDTLLLVGGLTDVCVHYTFVDGHQSDYFCRVIEDCVAGSSLEAHEASLKAMEYLQTGARCSLDSVLQAMEESVF